jgi:hypothetical protein
MDCRTAGVRLAPMDDEPPRVRSPLSQRFWAFFVVWTLIYAAIALLLVGALHVLGFHWMRDAICSWGLLISCAMALRDARYINN